MWLSKNEGAKFWLNVLTELQNRGVKDILIACVDGLKGFPDAINTVYPDTHIQLCIVHMVRNSMKFVPWKDYKAIAADLKAIYQATQKKKPCYHWINLLSVGMKNIRRSVNPGALIGKT
jgi:transposase-like protein